MRWPVPLFLPGPLLFPVELMCKCFSYKTIEYFSERNQAMTVLDRERKTAPRSALRYRPIDAGQAPASQTITRARKSRSDARVTTAPAAPDVLDMEEEHVPRRRAAAPAPRQPAPSVPTRRRIHPLLFVGLGLVVTMLLWVGISQLMAWGTNEYNNVVYGYPRTFQVDQVVGQGDSTLHPSHFVALNLRGTVSIIEFPAGDPSRARVLVSTSVLGPNADQAVVTLRFIDVSHNRRPDMLINIDGMQSVLVNDGKTFRPPTPAEQQQIFQHLQQSGS
jgi:hypothetical protein